VHYQHNLFFLQVWGTLIFSHGSPLHLPSRLGEESQVYFASDRRISYIGLAHPLQAVACSFAHLVDK